MTRIMFPYIACMSMVALAAGILNTWKRFAVPAATPVLLNLCVDRQRDLAGVALVRPRMAIEPIYGAGRGRDGWAACCSWLVQVPALRRHRVRCRASACRSGEVDARPGTTPA